MMVNKEYRSALALEQAVKAAAKKSGQDIGRAVEGFYTGRLLERVFSEEEKPFVLKGGRASSRVKDLVDLVLHVTRYEMTGSGLSQAIAREAGMRKIEGFHTFTVPESWRESYAGVYRKAATEAKISDRWRSVPEAEMIVKTCVDPAIQQVVEGFVWNPAELKWILCSRQKNTGEEIMGVKRS